MTSRFFEKLEKREVAYGAFTILNQPEVAEVMGAMGLDFVLMDMMMGSLDWRGAAAIANAADKFDITPFVRLPSFPWVGTGKNTDYHVAAEVLRAQTIGAQGVVVSLETPEQVAVALAPIGDDHRRVHLPSFEFSLHGSGREAASSTHAAPTDEPSLLIPLIESRLAIDTLDDILAVDGLKAIFLGMGDLSVILGHANDFAHPELTEFARTTIERANKQGVSVLINVHGREGIDEIAAAAKLYADIGAAGVFVPYDTQILIRFYRDLLVKIGQND